jgi:Protein of unknown function (DUF2568)
MRILSLAIRFLLELALLVALGVWGFTVGGGTFTKIVLGVGAPLAAAIVWGRFIAPKARRRLEDPARFSLELFLWMAGGLALLAAGHPAWALIFGALVAASLGLMVILGQRRTA